MKTDWAKYGPCQICNAHTGQWCLDMRGVPRGWVPNRANGFVVILRQMKRPHPGRKVTR